MGFVQDNLVPFFKKKSLVFKDSYQESEGVHTFRFEKEKGLNWKAGQYGLISISHRKIKNATKPFSIASAPSENVVSITTRVGDQPSEFKQALLELKPGMTVTLRGPVGPFYLQDNGPTLLIAGGIGITPFRSILKQLEGEPRGAGKPIHLLYMDSEGTHLFQDELGRAAERMNGSVDYVNAREQLHQAIDTFAGQHGNEAKYFIAGPKSMVDSIAEYLQSKQISKQAIKKDAFFGY